MANQSALQFIQEMIRLGARICQSGMKLDIRELFQEVSYGRIRSEILMEGVRQRDLDISLAKEVVFVNLALDAGSVLRIRVLSSILTNPWEVRFPIICDIFNNENYDSVQYELYVEAQLQKLFEANIICCGIISDNLAAQVSGIRECLYDTLDKRKHAISHVPCFAHLSNLVYVNVLNRDPVFKRLTEQICSMSMTLRKPVIVEVLGAMCPVVCRTRWLYVVDVLAWILRRENAINEMICDVDERENPKLKETVEKELPSVIPMEFRQLYDVLLPLKLFSLSVESSNARLCDVPVIVRQVLDMYRSIEWNSLNSDVCCIGKSLLAVFISRIRSNAREESIAAYLLSPAGRKEIRDMGSFRKRGKESEIRYEAPDIIGNMPPYFDIGGRLTRSGSSSDSESGKDDETALVENETLEVQDATTQEKDETDSESIDDEILEVTPEQVERLSGIEERDSIAFPDDACGISRMPIELFLHFEN